MTGKTSLGIDNLRSKARHAAWRYGALSRIIFGRPDNFLLSRHTAAKKAIESVAT
jgi:hypothetical protein